nr:VOC family protein [uncultured Dongia sp.]
MIVYTTLGTNDLFRSAAFFDAVLGELGAERCRSEPNLVGWRFPKGGAELYVLSPYDGLAASSGNGPMIGLFAGTPSAVRALHAKAIACGGTDEGSPGPRTYSPGFFAGYFRDPDGNKLNVFCFTNAATSP